MPTNFLEATGTNGFISTPFALGLVSGNNTTTMLTTSLDGSAPQSFTQTSGTSAQAIWGSVFFRSGGSFTPTAGGFIAGWFLRSPDGGTTTEKTVVNQAPPRSPDFTIPLYAIAYASGDQSWCQGGFVKLPWETYQVFIQNLAGSGASLPTSSTIRVGPVAIQY